MTANYTLLHCLLIENPTPNPFFSIFGLKHDKFKNHIWKHQIMLQNSLAQRGPFLFGQQKKWVDIA